MKTLLIVVFAVVLAGCTSYSIEKTYDPNTGAQETKVKVKSTRDLEQPELHYARSGNNDAEFDFKAAGVDNNTDAFLGMFGSMMQMMMQMFQANMIPIPAPGAVQ